MGLFGFDSVKDMFDGGGAGKSGSTYSTEGSSLDRDGVNNYQDPNPSSNSSSGGAPKTSLRPVARPNIVVAKDDKGNTKRNDRGDPVYTTSRDESNAASFVELNPAAASGNFSEYAPGTVNESNNIFQKMVRNHPLAQGLNFLSGSNTSDDTVVNIVDGKPIRQRENGSLYALNAMGLPYDVTGIDSLAAVPGQPSQQPTYSSGYSQKSSGGNNEPAAPEVVDPCPEGYVYDQEQLMCIIDTSTDIGVAPITNTGVDYALPDPMDVSPGGNPGYTQQMGNFIPTPLQPLAPNPIQQQLNQLSRSVGAPAQQQPRPIGLAGANSGIMQVRP
tara:strand:- start:4733 stop:5722 length:990 start_codon:yes stop_codon:yes gene_type:complete